MFNCLFVLVLIVVDDVSKLNCKEFKFDCVGSYKLIETIANPFSLLLMESYVYIY
jgi:hypothetical protein